MKFSPVLFPPPGHGLSKVREDKPYRTQLLEEKGFSCYRDMLFNFSGVLPGETGVSPLPFLSGEYQ